MLSLRFLRHRAKDALMLPWPGLGLRSLEFEDDPVFMVFCSSIGGCKTDAGCAVPALIDGLSSESPMVRAVSVYGLVLLGGTDPEHFDRIAELSGDREDMVRQMAVAALASFPLTRRSEGILDRALNDPSWNVRWAALRTIRAIGPNAAVFLDRLRQILENRAISSDSETGADLAQESSAVLYWAKTGPFFNPSLVNEAASAFVQIGGDPDVAVDAFAAAIEQCREGFPPDNVLDCLGWLRINSPRARQVIEPLLKDDSPDIQSAAAYAYAMSGGDRDIATSALIEALRADQQRNGRASSMISSRALWRAKG